jgi:hypothetical protein
MRFDDGPRSRRMIRGTIAGPAGYARDTNIVSTRDVSQHVLPTKHCHVCSVYQRDSSSGRPRASVVSAARPPTRRSHVVRVASPPSKQGGSTGSFHIRINARSRSCSALPPSPLHWTVKVLPTAKDAKLLFVKRRSWYIPGATPDGTTKLHDPAAAALAGVLLQLT